MWDSIAEFHAAANDLPAALFFASVVFDLVGYFTRRDSLRVAGFWTLIAAASGATVALVSGLRAEDAIEHGASVHRWIARHETLAITFTIVALGLMVWRVWRSDAFRPAERKSYLTLAVVALLGFFWTAKVGGEIMFDYAGGIETGVLESALADREAGHLHAPGEDDHEHGEATTSGPDSIVTEDHQHD